jgi:hypothetical protein
VAKLIYKTNHHNFLCLSSSSCLGSLGEYQLPKMQTQLLLPKCSASTAPYWSATAQGINMLVLPVLVMVHPDFSSKVFICSLSSLDVRTYTDLRGKNAGCIYIQSCPQPPPVLFGVDFHPLTLFHSLMEKEMSHYWPDLCGAPSPSLSLPLPLQCAPSASLHYASALWTWIELVYFCLGPLYMLHLCWCIPTHALLVPSFR